MQKEEITFLNAINKLTIIFLLILSKWKIILISSILGAVLGLYLSYISVKNYESKLNFVVEEDGGNSGGAIASIANSIGIGGAEQSVFTSANIIEFMEMRNLVEQALMKPVNNNNKLSFAQLYINEHNLNSDWKTKKELKKIKFLPTQERSTFTLAQDSILGQVYNMIIQKKELTVQQPNLETSIIEITCKTKSELFSMYFPQVLIEVVGDYYIETKTKKIKLNLATLQYQTDSVRNELLNSLVGVASNTDQVFGLNPAMNLKRVPTAQKQVDVQANTAMLTELVKNLELTKVNLMNQKPLIEIVDRPILPLAVTKLGKSKAILTYGFIFGFLSIFIVIIANFIQNLKNNKTSVL